MFPWQPDINLLARTTGDPRTLIPAVRAAVAHVNDGTLQSPLDNLPLRWFMCADGRGVLSAGVEIVPAW